MLGCGAAVKVAGLDSVRATVRCLGEMSEEHANYDGGCHCGSVRFSVTVAEHTLLECNCSMCRMKAYLHLIVAPEHFRLLQGEEALTTYSFNTGVAKHRFCAVCGVQPFYRPRSHPDKVSVNARCLDGETLQSFQIRPFDGKNWEANVHKIQHQNPSHK